jgi:deferrochelatase/peroxidase EfeB
MTGIDRRGFLRTAAAAAGGLTVGGLASSGLPSVGVTDGARQGPVQIAAFHGPYQSGILSERQHSVAFVAFDVTASTRTDLIRLMRVLTTRSRSLMQGGEPPELGISAPPADSGILGADAPSDGLTITVGIGATMFDHRFGLAGHEPKRLRRMEAFPNDNLDRARCDGDILIQICAQNPDTVIHALRDLARNTRGYMQPRWRIDGFSPPPRPAGTPRNLMGFKDGTANPDPTDRREMSRLVWVQRDAGEPAWATGGTYQVVRVIRMLVEFWDRVDIGEQERMFGRRKDTGAPLSGRTETDTPNYTNDPTGATIPLDSHIRLANPRTSRTDPSRILRRAYNYDEGIDSNGNLSMGLIFTCFQQDLDRQFVAVQQRLADEPLVDYISPIGGGYFFALPGVRDNADFYARDLLT